MDLDKAESEAYKLVQDIIDAHARGVSEIDLEKKWRALEERYGKDLVARARELSFMLVSSMRPDNPLRNIGYVVGILRHEARD